MNIKKYCQWSQKRIGLLSLTVIGMLMPVIDGVKFKPHYMHVGMASDVMQFNSNGIYSL